MDAVNSFKGYGKVDPPQDAAFRRKTRKRIIILSVSLFLLLVLIIAVVAGTLAHRRSNTQASASSTTGSALKAICGVTLYPDSCIASLSSSNSTNPQKIFNYSLSVVLSALEKLASFPDQYSSRTNDPMVKQALTVCGTVLNDAVDSLNDTIATPDGNNLLSSQRIDDLKTLLSTVITDQEACLDALVEVNATFVDEIKLLMRDAKELASNSLAIVSKIIGLLKDFNIPTHRRLLTDGFPSWVSPTDRRLLQSSQPLPNVTVAQDGSGDVSTIAEAVQKIPSKSNYRFVIYVKAGRYVENVSLLKSHWNVMIYGDGKTSSIISGSRNFVDGTPTFSTATVAVVGQGFIARDIGFANTAGAAKHQAVAFRSASDQSVYFRCSFDGFQDTLYAYANRQFYRNCDISGTIDFIFGNSAVVFQNCNILPRQPLANQFNTVTAQGKIDPNQNTGISIQRCVISPLDALTRPTYLGRPWKSYSTTVVMQTTLGGFLNPLGWIPWVSGVDPPSTIFYGEYQNIGPGSSTANRVKWAGYRSTLTAAQASQFSVTSFIQGPTWLPATSITFDAT